jgi:hypothetical protein
MTAPDGLSLEAPPFSGPAGDRLGGALAAFWDGARIACPPDFAAAVLALAARRRTTPGALASAALLLVGATGYESDPGPGEAYLDLVPPPDADDGMVRRALALALALAEGKRPLREAERVEIRLQSLEYRNKALSGALERLAFQPLDGGVTDAREAARLFGFVNEWCFDEARVLKRFRELAPVYHPDTGVVACRERMAQLIEARNLLVRHVRTAYVAGGRKGR